MRYLSVCSGIEAATVAWHHMGWQPVAFSDIEPFPSAVLAHHYPHVPNLGDMTKFEEWNLESVELLVGGTPCQSFSVAGLRKGLADPRGNLMLTFLAIAQRQRPRWIVWENVPGVLSSNGGRDFGTFLGALGELGYGFAYRVLDAQWFGVAQRRRRVFVVGYLGDWQRPAKVLFESESVCRDTPPSRKAGQEVAGTIAARFGNSRNNHEECVPTVAGSLDTECGGGKLTHQSITNGHVIGTITARMFNALGARDVEEGALLPVGFGAQMSVPQTDVDLMQTLQAKNPMAVAQPIHYRKSRRAQSINDHETWVEDGVSNTLNCFDVGDVRATDVVATITDMRGMGDGTVSPTLRAKETANDFAPMLQTAMQVRRLTPVECERLQGFPDNYTNIPWRKKAGSPDGPRYKAMGNSMAVPVMRWIGERIQKVNQL